MDVTTFNHLTTVNLANRNRIAGAYSVFMGLYPAETPIKEAARLRLAKAEHRAELESISTMEALRLDFKEHIQGQVMVTLAILLEIVATGYSIAAHAPFWVTLIPAMAPFFTWALVAIQNHRQTSKQGGLPK